MLVDHDGNELRVGDQIAVRFEVTNIIADSENRNILVRHVDSQTGLPDDYRLSLDARSVVKIGDAPAKSPSPADSTAAPEEMPQST